MADRTRIRSLVLLKGSDKLEALKQFEAFVIGTGGDQETVNRDIDFFYQWRDLQQGEGVLFTRQSGKYGVMKAFVITSVTLGNELQSGTERPQPLMNLNSK